MSSGPSLAWADFQPSRLQAARQGVVQLHPSTGDKLRAASGSELEELKARVAAAQADEEALEELALELTASQLRGVAVQLGPWEGLRTAVATVLRARPKSSVLPHLWSTWQRYPRAETIRRVLRDYADEFSWSSVAEGYETAAESWTEATAPGIAIQEWLDDQGLTYSDLEDLADLPLQDDVPLIRAVRDAVMTHGSRAQLQTEGADRLVGWYPVLNSADRMGFGKNYLMTLDPNSWEEDVLGLLAEAYGRPRDGRTAFWDQLPQEVRDAVHRWFIERNLREALGSDTERHRYWIRWAEELDDVELGQAGRVEYAVLYFETFGVIEFFETGNAAYFYPRDQLEDVRSRSAGHPSRLKDRYHPGFGNHGDNRLIHNQRWQRKADRQVRTWIRRTS